MQTFSALLALCEGKPLVTGGFPSQRPVTRSFCVFFDLRLNTEGFCKQPRRRWFETPSRSLWRHCNVFLYDICFISIQISPKFDSKNPDNSNPASVHILTRRRTATGQYLDQCCNVSWRHRALLGQAGANEATMSYGGMRLIYLYQ